MDIHKELDARGLICPLPILKAKKALSDMHSGEILKVMATDPGSVRDFQAFARQTGNDLIDQQALQARYKEDPQRLQAEMFKLYKENKVNPFGGCWPMLLPYPLLVAVFFVLACACLAWRSCRPCRSRRSWSSWGCSSA